MRSSEQLKIQHSCSGKRQSRLQHSTLRFARNSTSALPTTQHSKLNILFPHPTDGTRRAILRWGTLDSIIT